MEMLDENTNRIKAIIMHNGILNINAENTCAEMSLFLPFSSDTNFAKDLFKPKSDANCNRETRNVKPATTPISSWEIILAIKARPKAPIIVDRIFRIVRYTEPTATFAAVNLALSTNPFLALKYL